MAVTTFILAVIGAITGVASLGWNIVSFSLQGARPQLTPIVGILTASGLAHADATRDIRQSLASAAQQLPAGQLVVGVKVVNAGRAPFHVGRWALRSDPSATSLTQFDALPGSPAVECDIAPSATKIFYTALNDAYALAAAGKTVDGKPQRIVVTVESGGRTLRNRSGGVSERPTRRTLTRSETPKWKELIAITKESVRGLRCDLLFPREYVATQLPGGCAIRDGCGGRVPGSPRRRGGLHQRAVHGGSRRFGSRRARPRGQDGL